MQKIEINFPISATTYQLAIRLFNNNVVKVIVANGLTEDQLQTANNHCQVIRFPENLLSLKEISMFVDTLISIHHDQTFIIITNNTAIATSVPQALCRIGQKTTNDSPATITSPKNETFAQNQLDFVIDNNALTIPTIAAKFLKNVVENIQTNNWREDNTVKEAIMTDIELCGDSLIYFTLYGKLDIVKRRADSDDMIDA